MKSLSYDKAFMSELQAANIARPPLATTLFMIVIAILLVAFGLWTVVARIDEVAVGMGKVIPSSQVQMIQNLEGGILTELLVREGETVEQGQILLRVDATGFESELRQNRAKALALEGQIARLLAETDGAEIAFPSRVLAERPDIVERESALFRSRLSELQAALQGLEQQVEQRRQEVNNLRSRDQSLSRNLALVQQELSMSQELAAKGYRSKLEVLKLEQKFTDLDGQVKSTRIAIPQAQAALSEAERKLEERRLSHRSQALAELAHQKGELAALYEALRAQEDRVTRRDVRSPVHGVVKHVKVHTIGGVIQPGADLIEIVPMNDQLLVEARVSPADIAFIRPGQKATVKLTAYDYSIYGGLPAELEHISADSLTNERGEPYYLIRVRTQQNYLGTEEKKLAVMPGMVATVDIVTGDKTVFQYIMKPLLKTTERALRER
ncbi:MAG TPA: HlyD family type I secretion periplasmic adaptor subunit [Alphaproteobacteria bacterium]|nr:HlyD family type I secretion periplasmic adaptor subunit [Alphaproteobacteria bacterium]